MVVSSAINAGLGHVEQILQTILDWIKRYILHFDEQNPKDLGSGKSTVLALLDLTDVSNSMIYTHVLNKGGLGVSSPLDVL